MAEPNTAIEKKCEAPSVVYRQLTFDAFEHWTPPMAREALAGHEAGLFIASAKLADAFGRDERIAAAMRTRVSGALGLPFEIKSAKPGDPIADKLAEQAKAWWPNVAKALPKLLRDRVLMGFSTAQIHWGLRNGLRIPTKVERWHPGLVWFEKTKREYRAQTQEGLVLTSPGQGVWFLSADEESFMEGAVRFLVVPFLVRMYAHADWAHFTERHGFPILVAKFPDGDRTPERDQFFKDVASLGRKGIIRLPQNKDGEEQMNYALDLLEAKDSTWQNFPAILSAMSIAIAIGILGQHLTTEVSATGSFALGKAQEEVRQDLKEADVESLASDVREQIMRPFARYNAGPRFEHLAPIPCWDPRTPQMAKTEAEARKAEAEAANAAIAAMKAAKEAGVPLDFNRFAKCHKLPMTAEMNLTPTGP